MHVKVKGVDFDSEACVQIQPLTKLGKTLSQLYECQESLTLYCYTCILIQNYTSQDFAVFPRTHNTGAINFTKRLN